MKPKATLLSDPWADYTFYLGKASYTLLGGVATPVPVAVALHLQKKKKDDGSQMFRVTGMPVIVSKKEKEKKVRKQNVDASRCVGARQLVLIGEECLSNAA